MIIRYQERFTKLGTVGTVSDPPQLNKIDMATSAYYDDFGGGFAPSTVTRVCRSMVESGEASTHFPNSSLSSFVLG